MVKLYSGETDLDVGEFSTTLTFSIADIREPDKRNAAFSKTLTLPGTKANNLFFENMFEVDVVTQTFNPNLKARTILSIDGVTQFKGALKLRQVNYLLSGEVTYDCNLIGNLADIFLTLGNSRLRDLDFSAYNHLWTSTNIINSWSQAPGSAYVYPMVNYGTVSDLSNWKVTDLRPALFAKEILDKIFTFAGYTYSSSFITGNLFKRMIIPHNNDLLRLTGSQINNRLFNAGRVTPNVKVVNIGGAYTEERVQINDDSTGAYFDNDGSFNTALFEQVPLYNGISNYFFNASLVWSITKGVTGGGQSVFCDYYVNIFRNRSGTITQMNGDTGQVFLTPAAGAGTYTGSSDQFGTTLSITLGSEFNDIQSGDKYYVFIGTQLGGDAAVISSLSTSVFSMDNIGFYNSITNDIVNEADTIEMTNMLPDMLMKDFLLGIIRMFNLYLEPDKDDDLILKIEPRDDYYTTTQVDWSDKLATEKNLEIEPMALLNFKRILAKYTDDTDYYNKVYKAEYTTNYGSARVDINNDFVTGEYKIESAFSPTPLVGSYTNDRIIPTIYGGQGTPPVVEPIQSNPRILYWAGLKNCESWTLIAYSGSSIRTQYPYAGHLDDPEAPTIDLSFGVPQKVYYGVNQFIPSLTYTDNNLYNKYYSRMISEVTDRDSKLVTGYFWLTPVDILQLDFRKIYRVGTHALRLNKIYDYNPIKSNLTKCEFIKIKDTETFSATSVGYNGGINVVINSREDAPVIDLTTFQDGNIVARPSSTVITGEKNYAGGGLSIGIHGRRNRVHGRDSSGVAIWGEDNTVQAAASGVTIHGYQNTVGFGVKNIFIHGKNNIINPGLSNIALINTDNQTVTESDVSYFNNTKFIKVSGSGASALYETGWQSSTSKTLFTSPLVITGGEAPAAGYAKIPVGIVFALDAGAVAYNFAASNVFLAYASTPTVPIQYISRLYFNSATDVYYYLQNGDGFDVAYLNDGLVLAALANATTGNGTYYFKVIYRLVQLPF